ncbi:MAG TPA: N-6 DNA methylase [Methylocella sp.]|jgi:type I restriction enzyme M protein
MFHQVFKNIDDVLWKEAGCTTELDYTEQTSWMLFLKYLDDLEHEKAISAELVGKPYASIIDKPHRWSSWAAPKKADGSFDHDKALTGDDLIAYVNDELFPYLKGFKQRATGPDTIEYKIGEIFGEIKNKFQSGYSLRDALELMDGLRFRSQKEKHELSHLYEAKIKNMGNAGRNGGEYYTPRPLIRAMIRVVKPQIGERIYDGALGSAGFLCEAYEYLRHGPLTTGQLKTLQTKTFYGKEKKSLAYVIAIMNMILHGIEAPNVIHTNTLAENISDIQGKDRFDVILANPPFGGKERPEVQQNFPIKTGETAFLFLQHFIKSLRAGGRAAVVIKNTFLSNSDNAARALRKELLENCNLHTVLDCPGGTFLGAGVKTVVLFFEKGAPTRKVWYYQLDPGRNMGKTNSLNDNDLKEFVELQASFADSEKSWSVDVKGIDKTSFDLSVKNPNKADEAALRDPQDIIAEIAALDAENAEILEGIRYLNSVLTRKGDGWVEKTLQEVSVSFGRGKSKHRPRNDPKLYGGPYPFIQTGDVRNCDHVILESSQSYNEIGLAQSKLWPKGTICITIAANIAETGILGFDACFPDSIIGMVADEAKTSNDFVEYLLQSMKAQLKAQGKGSAQDNINLATFENKLFPFPPLDEQERIVATLNDLSEKIQKLEIVYDQKLAALAELKQSILQKAFAGELTARPEQALQEAVA